jgi:hypothetical protein
MKHGDPFLTKELDLQRAGQRKTLRLIPEPLIPGYVVQAIRIPDDLDRGFAETVLRDRADVELETLGTALVTITGSEEAETLRTLLERFNRYPFQGQDPFREVRNETNRLAQPRSLPNWPGGNDADWALVRLVHLLTWADDIADDGYSDKRVPRPN